MTNINNFEPLENYPHRICLDIVHSISKYTKHKTVCNIGCGAGDLLEFLKINDLCNDVIGIEKTNRIDKNKKYIIHGNALKITNFPEADVYIMCLGPNFPYEKILPKLKNECTIIYLDSSEKNQNIFSNYNDIELIEKKSYEYDETKFINKNNLDDHNEQLLKIPSQESIWTVQGSRIYCVYRYNVNKK